jgi:hypothetical protein
VILLNHLAQNPVDPQAKMLASIHCWAPWMDHDERRDLVERIAARPRRYKAKTLAAMMRLTEEEHASWGIESIWAFTWTDADVKGKSKQRDRKYQKAKRAASREPLWTSTRAPKVGRHAGVAGCRRQLESGVLPEQEEGRRR